MVPKLNEDIYAEIITYLNPFDVLSFLQTTTELYYSRSLWAHASIHIGKTCPLACAQNTDISLLVFPELREIVLRTILLTKTWQHSSVPYISTRTVFWLKGERIIDLIPGTGLVFTLRSRIVRCRDVLNGRVVGSVSLSNGSQTEHQRYFTCFSCPSVNDYGHWVLALGLKTDPGHQWDINVLTIDYTRKNAVTFSNVRHISTYTPEPYSSVRVEIKEAIMTVVLIRPTAPQIANITVDLSIGRGDETLDFEQFQKVYLMPSPLGINPLRMSGEVLLRQGDELFLLFLTETFPVFYSMAPSPDVAREPRYLSISAFPLLKGAYKDVSLNRDVPLQKAIVGSSNFHLLVQLGLNTDNNDRNKRLVECVTREPSATCTLEVPYPVTQLQFECFFDYRLGLLYSYTADSNMLYVTSYGAALPGSRFLDKFRRKLYYLNDYVSDLPRETLQLLILPVGWRFIAWLQGLGIISKTLGTAIYWMLFTFVYLIVRVPNFDTVTVLLFNKEFAMMITRRDMKSAFKASRLTSSTFLVIEYDDVYDEHPFIYCIISREADAILLIDTGCGGASREPGVEIRSLRQFLETVNVVDNDDQPLNKDGVMPYIVATTHCHYDHILAVDQFKDSVILASSYDPSFLASSELPEHSLCNFLGISCPSYTPILVPHQHSVTANGISLGVNVLHTPGHTPDEIALYNPREKMLYVGDSLYEDAPIIFPNEGSIVDWFDSVDFLIALVVSEGKDKVRINAGHQTANRPALEVLTSAKAFLEDVVSGKEPVRTRMNKRGEETVVYHQTRGRYSLMCPEHLVLQARSWWSLPGRS